MNHKRHESALNRRLNQEARDQTIFDRARDHAWEYMGNVDAMPVFPNDQALSMLPSFQEKLPDDGASPADILDQLHHCGSPATAAATGGRYFGFVTGGALPAAMAAKWLADVWDQNAGLYISSPVAAVLEDVCEQWLVGLLGLPESTAAGLVSGSTTATLCGLAAARNHILQQNGYDVAARGLFGAPEIQVVLGAEAHASVFKALSILGLGSERVIRVPVDDQGRLDPAFLPELDTRSILILQAGNVNSGAFDDFSTLCARGRQAGSWVHIDGAFGLWAAASPLKHLATGLELADSWALDAHKTLNAPYDCGIVLCRERPALVQAMQMSGSYIMQSEHRDGLMYTLDMSRRARVVELWATLKSLGRSGVSDLTEELHRKSCYFADSLEQAGFFIRNEVCFNQVLVSAGDPDLTARILADVQHSGECWCGGTVWKNEPLIRVSVCSYRTSYADIDRSVAAFAAARERAS